MNENYSPYLLAAKQALERKEPEQAKQILVPFVEQNPQNAEAWFLLSGAFDDPRTIVACLRNTLAIEPTHSGATAMLAQIEKQHALAPLTVMRVTIASAAMGHKCPFCLGDFKAAEEVVVCPKDQTSHHYECWVENGHACAATLCDGFSVNELYQPPLSPQPLQQNAEMIVIQKEDISQAGYATRKDQEERFQRQMLMLALMKEEGALPPGGDVPSVDDLLDQIQRDRSATAQSRPGHASVGTPARTSSAKYCANCGQPYPRAESKFCAKCGQPRAT